MLFPPVVSDTSCWEEDSPLSTVVHVLNLSPCSPLNFDIPERVWTGKDVSYDHLRVFGCKAFVHIPKDERSKLDVKTRQCVFLGYGLDDFGYKFYDPVEKKLVRSRDAVFMENQTIEDIDRVREMRSRADDSIDSKIVPPTEVPEQVGDENQIEQQDAVDAPIDDEAELPTPEAPAPFQLFPSLSLN